MNIILSWAIFILAGLCEIGGGYLVWLCLKQGKPWWVGVLGAGILGLYGVVATLQPASFARVYATYGGIFIIMSILWAMAFDRFLPDKYDIIGVLVVLLGVCIIYYAPRNG
jgi:small multidrug resistance family-3 protein